MTKYFLFMILGACFVLLILPAVAGARPNDGDRVCIYKHDNFHGQSQCFRPGEQISDLKDFDVNSIRVSGSARVMLYEKPDFRGRMLEFTGDMPNLSRVSMSGSKPWHDHVGSLRILPQYAYYERDRYYDRDRYPYENGIVRTKPSIGIVDEGVCVYEKPGFDGRFQCWSTNTDISDLSFANWKDRISSVRVFGNARLVGYKDTDFHGERVILDHDVSDLGNIPMRTAGNWNDEIRSLAVEVQP